MNVVYLKHVSKVNLEMLPPIMAEEYNKTRFEFDSKLDGTNFSRKAFDNIYAEIQYCISKKEMCKRLEFNKIILDSEEEYDDGFWDGYYEEELFAGITKEEDQVFEIFSRVHKKLKLILNPSITQFKKNIHLYNNVNFIQKHLYDYGYEVGVFLKAWKIILNNITLFEDIFTKHYPKNEDANHTNPYREIFTGTDDKAFRLFDDFAKEVTDDYLDFSFIFQKMKSKSENLIIEHIRHLEFMNWLFQKRYISESTYSDFKIKASFTTKADRGMRATRYYKLKEKYFPDISNQSEKTPINRK